MNVSSGSSSTSSTSTASPAASSDSTTTQAAQNPKEDSGFKDEMKTAQNDKNAKEPAKQDDTKKDSKDNNLVPKIALNGGVDFTDYKYNVHQEMLSRNIRDLMNTQDMLTKFGGLGTSLDYKNMKMSDGDALFFSDLVKNTNMSMQGVAQYMQNAVEGNVAGGQQKVQVSETLMNLIHDAAKTNQPVRIDFDKDVSVILKINRDGSISANFIPGDKAAEQYLKENIPFLKQRFDEQQLPYSELNYSRQKQQQEQQKRNNKENSDE